MTELEIAKDNRSAASGGNLRYQSQPPTTNAQTVFDVLFGVVAPILCFVLDPGILKSGSFGFDFDLRLAIFPQLQGFVYLVSGLEILLLLVWLVGGRQPKSATHLVGGVLMSGAIFSGLIGTILLPFTLMGLFLGIGVFGFVPFLTALVYLRNARSAFQVAAKPLDLRESLGLTPEAQVLNGLRGSLAATVIGCVLAVGPPAALSVAASMFVSQAMNAVLSADEQQADLAIDEIRYLQIFAQPPLDKLVSAYNETTEQSRKEALRRRYLKLTGDDIDQRLRIIND